MTQFKVGSRVRTKIDCVGDVEGEGEITVPSGALATVTAIELHNNAQGLTVTLSLDAGVDQVFDQQDGLLNFFFEVVDEPPASPFEDYDLEVSLRVNARSYDDARMIALQRIVAEPDLMRIEP